MSVSYKKHLKDLKERVCEANLYLYKSGLVISTFGNVSERFSFEDQEIIGIKPSGVAYEKLTSDQIVILNMSGEILSGDSKPSTDTPTHLYLYKKIKSINGISHSHSTYATAWSQAGLHVPCLGTTHADYAKSHIPCTVDISKHNIIKNYEENTAKLILSCLQKEDLLDQTMILVKNHGPFTFGKSGIDSVDNSILLEEICKIAFFTHLISPKVKAISSPLHAKHYNRKHGAKKYYGQN